MNGIPWWFFTNVRGNLAGQRLTAVDPDGVIVRTSGSTARMIFCELRKAA